MKRLLKIVKITGAALVLLTAFTQNCAATVSAKDVIVLGRVIALMDHGPTGTVDVAIVQGGEATQADTHDMLAAIGPGKTIGPLTLTAHPVRYDGLSCCTAPVLFIPAGMSAHELDTVFAFARERKVITISTSDGCLAAQKCAIVITSEPAVDIRLSIAAAAATNVRFSSTFRMIIKEVQ